MIRLVLSVLLIFPVSAQAWNAWIVQKKDGLLYADEKPFHQGLPADVKVNDIQRHGQRVYMTTSGQGIFKRDKNDSAWINITPNDARTRTVGAAIDRYRSISALCVDANDANRVYFAAKYSWYTSHNAGASWIKLPLAGLPANACITALYARGNEVLAGTSWNGAFRYSGGRFHAYNHGLPGRKYSSSVSFFEEIERISSGYMITRYSAEVFKRGGTHWEKQFSGTVHGSAGAAVYDGSAVIVSNNRLVEIGRAASHPYELSLKENKCALFVGGNRSVFVKKIDKKKDGIYGLYAGAPTSWGNIKKAVRYARETGSNALVFDVKDDYGNVFVHNETSLEIGAVRKGISATELCRYLRAKSIHSIARIVVFKDARLFKAFNNTYAIMDSSTKKPWRGNEKEYWVDPYSQYVHQYNTMIAREAVKAGFDEIQFDYIRFPTDGPVHRCYYTHKPGNGIYKYEAITSFLRTAKQIDVPISVDVYGFTVWYQFGMLLGQDVEEMTSIVDVVCPMIYPSHFGRPFFDGNVSAQGYYDIIYESVRRALMQSHAVVRPYLQAFDMLSPHWGYDYIRQQIRACTDAGADGYIFWNAGVDYDVMLTNK